MKNCLYFDCQYCTGLLCSEEDDLNSIVIVITPDSDNQKLEIKAGSNTTTVDLIFGEKNCVAIPDELWNLGGDTLFRFCKGTPVCEWYTITFPEDITTQVMLCEDGERRYKVCGPESEDIDLSEYEVAVVPYRNMVGHIVKENEQKLVAIGYTSRNRDTSALFTVTIGLTASDISGTAEMSFAVVVNKQYDEFFLPKQTITNGSHTITFTYPVEEIVANSANKLYVYASVDQGSVQIKQQAIRAALIAQGLMRNNDWDGMIEVDDTYKHVNLNTSILLPNMDEYITINTDQPTSRGVTETMQTIKLNNTINIGAMNDAISIEWGTE